MSHLRAYEKQLYEKVFREVDKNRDGSLNKEELQVLCMVLGFKIGPNQFKALFVGLDRNQDSRITLDEFLAAMPNVKPKERNCAYLRRLFLALDTNKDGFLTAEELNGAIKRDGAPIGIEKLQALVFQADEDEDGRINYEEFLYMAMDLM